ncbi:MAG: acetylornithine/succinylornithine family transaminase [Deltaproteobacteria bacterium]|nr:MAG: acetylornithine/succinylornithine family transaminase [Deltaproteobacteria bacterium]
MNALKQDPSTSLLHRAEHVLAPTYKRPDTLFVRGDGCHLYDAHGNEYIDMTSGVAVNALGHRSPVVMKALRDAAEGLVHTSNLFHTAPAIQLADALVRHSFADKVFFANSGAESVEGAIKFARLYGGEARHEIVYMDGSFHGRTLGALSATDREKIRLPFKPLPQGYSRAPWNNPAALDAVTTETAAVIVEPIQGEGGIRLANPSWMRSLRQRCNDTGTLLIFDEIQGGLGRTGKLWAHEHYNVTPDLMTLAKPLAGGLPMGAVLMTDRVAEAVTYGCHATTFGGGPVVASVALAVFEEVARPEFLSEVRKKGSKLVEMLQALNSPHIDEIRGPGLFVGVRLHEDLAKVTALAREEKLLLVGAGDNVIRFIPSLNVTQAVLEEAVARFGRVLRRLDD